MLINRKPGFYVAVVRRLPNGLGMKAPRDHSGKNPELLSAFPNETSVDNLRSYYRVWSKRRTNFINFGCVNNSSSLMDQRRWIHFNSSRTAPAAKSDDDPTMGDGDSCRSPYDTSPSSSSGSKMGDSGMNNNNTIGKVAFSAASPSPSSTFSSRVSSSPRGTLGLAGERQEQQQQQQHGVVLDDGKKQKKSSSSSASASPSGKFTTATLHKKHQQNVPITMVTAYDYPSAQIADSAVIDMILVGDSVAMVVLGHDDTLQVNVDEMLHHCKSVARGSNRAFLIGDMPFGSYLSVDSAVNNAARFIKEGRMDGVKLEGGRRVEKHVRAIVDAGIVVVGHIGLTPQSYRQLGGFKVQGKSKEEFERIIEDAKALEAAGASAIVLEMVPAELAAKITETISIPTIGIGAGPSCSGQVLVFHDICGLYDKLQPKFSKCYANTRATMQKAIETYKNDVISRNFPSIEHSFYISKPVPMTTEAAVKPSATVLPVNLMTGTPRALGSFQQQIDSPRASPKYQHPSKFSSLTLMNSVANYSEMPRAPFSGLATNPAANKRIVIIGGGSMGSLFAGKIAFENNSSDVWLLTEWKDHSQAIQKEGLSISRSDSSSSSSSLNASVSVADSSSIDKLARTADIVLVMVKAPETSKAAELAKKIAKVDTGIVVTLQNGLGGKDIVEKALSEGSNNKYCSLYGVTSQAASIQTPGTVRHTGEGPTVLVCKKNNEAEAQLVAEILTSSGIPTVVKSEHEGEPIVWSKLLVNACINPLAAMFKVNNGRLLEAPYNRVLSKLVDETATTAKALGIATTYPLDQLSEQVRTVIEKTRDNQNSMIKDLDLDKQTEFEYINGELIRRARDARLPIPPVQTALNTLFSALTQQQQESTKHKTELQVIDTIAAYRKHRASFERDEIVGFVPTMGALHEGHLTLVRNAKEKCDKVVVSIFVNPTQFAPHEDLQKYPRPVEQDLKLLRQEGVDVVFLPSDKEMYPQKQSIFVVPNSIEAVSAESFARPHFFRGVGTVCSKLFNIVTPHHVFFGQKDAVQAILIKNMVRELNFPIDVNIVDTVREHDGLAMSSRNVYLAPEERKTAPIIYRSLQSARDAFEKGERSVKVLREIVRSGLTSSPMVQMGYVSLADGDTAVELKDEESLRSDGVTLLSVAVVIGKTRLIDNILLR